MSLVFLVLNAAFGVYQAVADELIANPGLGLKSLGSETVRALFTMRLRQWPDGGQVRVFVLPDRHPVHRAFAKQVLGVFPHQLRRSWDRMVFSGTGQAPTQVEDEEDMIRWVAKTPGAVGYIAGPKTDSGVSIVVVE